MSGILVVVGSVHKLGEMGLEVYGNEIKEYVGSSRAVIAGDQNASFCDMVGLKAVAPGNGSQGFTWPASCKGFGTVRGDNICTNMKEMEPEHTTKPCVTERGFEIELGDHALTSVVLGVTS